RSTPSSSRTTSPRRTSTSIGRWRSARRTRGRRRKRLPRARPDPQGAGAMFENSLIASKTPEPSKFRLLILPVALVVHAVVITGVVLAQYWAVDPVAEP